MAGMYTRDDFNKKLADSGVNFSDHDLKLAHDNPDAGMGILYSKIDYENATNDAERAAANQQAEGYRKNYGGYTAGADGKGFNLGDPTPVNFGYEEFSYDVEKDPMYQSYKKQYMREGERATADTMGIAAGMTGGLPSSYAMTAASQQGNYYAGQLADKVPELYQNARNNYNNERQFAYGQYMDEYNAQAGLRQEQLNKEQADRNWMIQQASLAYNAGDYDKLKQMMGINAGNPDFEKMYNLAVHKANQGDNTYLDRLVSQYFK